MIFVILLIALIIRLYRLPELLPFIGDYAWFYLSARDMLIDGSIPLVGIASSHPWLHQGPLWTYLLAFVLWMYKFSPVSGGYLAVLFGMLTLYMITMVSNELFSKRVGVIALLLYATSPLAIIYSRVPYHTAPISFLTLLFILSLYRWVRGSSKSFVLAIFLLAVLYNFELSTTILSAILVILFIFGIYTKKTWMTKLKDKKIAAYSLVAFIIPLIPVLIYDISNGFPQTLKFVVWILYKLVSIFIPLSNQHSSISYQELFSFLGLHLQRLIFLDSNIIAYAIIAISTGWFVWVLYKQYKKRKIHFSYLLIFIWAAISLLGYIINKSTSEAYLPILIPWVVMVIALFFDYLMNYKKVRIVFVLILMGIAVMNVRMLLAKNYLMIPNGGYGYTLTQRISASNHIIHESLDKEYNLIGKGPGSQFESFTDTYEYLTWWLGKEPSKHKTGLLFIVEEIPAKIKITKHD